MELLREAWNYLRYKKINYSHERYVIVPSVGYENAIHRITMHITTGNNAVNHFYKLPYNKHDRQPPSGLAERLSRFRQLD